ncbi:MAG: hypothetical protein JSW50_01350, partial [Candidatus Latescibacterota bacterium]
MAWQLPLLFVLFVVLLVWLENHLKNAFYATNLKSVERLSEMVVSRVETSMEAKETGRIWDGVERWFPTDEDIRMKIVNKRGAVLFSSDPAAKGQTHHLTDAPCVPCHMDGSARASVRSKFIDEPLGEPYTVFVAPLYNTQSCQACHDEDGSILGMVYVWNSLDPVQKLVRTIQFGLIIAGV